MANLYLNTGHGTLGWTMACGSAHVLADQIGCREPEIEAGDLGISRYGINTLNRLTRKGARLGGVAHAEPVLADASKRAVR